MRSPVFPDILLIDGGKGQLNAALEVFRLLGKEPPCLISLAKREEEIYRPGDAEPIRLSRHAAALRLLQYVRDEAHRFAQHYHHLLRRKKLQDEDLSTISRTGRKDLRILLTNDDGVYAPGLGHCGWN